MRILKKSWNRFNIWWAIHYTYGIKHRHQVKKYKKKYPDYEDNEYNCGSLVHVWGVKSWDDLTGKDAFLYTMNDIDITYDRDKKEYYLGIETAYLFNGRKDEREYLRRLHGAFTEYMLDNGFSTANTLSLFFSSPRTSTSAKTIEELYSNFTVFVDGYCKVNGYEMTTNMENMYGQDYEDFVKKTDEMPEVREYLEKFKIEDINNQ